MIFNLFRLFGAFVSVSLTIFVATQYPPIIASKFFIAYSSLFLVSSVLKFGFEDTVLKAGASGVSDTIAVSWIVGITTLSLLFSFFLYIIDFFSILKLARDDALLVCAIIPTNVVCTLTGFYLQGKRRYVTSTIVQAIIVPGSFVFFAMLCKVYGYEYPLLNIYLLASIIGLICALSSLYSHVNHRFEFKFCDLIKVDWKEQKFLYVNSLMSILALHGVVVASALLLVPAEVVELNLILRICQTSSVIILVLNFTFAPKIRELHNKKDQDAVMVIYSKSVGLGLTLALIASVFYYFFIEIFGTYFSNEVNIPKKEFWILWLSYATNLALGTIGYLYIMTDRARISSLTGLAVTSVMFFILWLLRPDNLVGYVIIVAIFSALTRLCLFAYWAGGRINEV